MNRKALRDRWRDQPDLARAAFIWLANPSSPAPEGIEVVDGRVDLRGLPAFPADLRKLDDIRWEDIDLSESDLTGLWLSTGHIQNCVLANTDLRRTKFGTVELTNSNLSSADLRQASMGNSVTGTWPTMSDVDFTKANISGERWTGVTITRCTFRDTKLKRTTFGRCLLTDTVFATDLTEVEFQGTRTAVSKVNPFPDQETVPLRGLDFSEAHFDGTAFRQCAMEGTQWPDDPDVRIVEDPDTRIPMAIDWLTATEVKNNAHAAKDLKRLLDDADTHLPDGRRFVVVELGFWRKPLFKADVEEALFGAGQKRATSEQ